MKFRKIKNDVDIPSEAELENAVSSLTLRLGRHAIHHMEIKNRFKIICKNSNLNVEKSVE